MTEPQRTDDDWVCAHCEFEIMPAEYNAGAPPMIRRCELCSLAICAHHMFKVPNKAYSMCTGCKGQEHGLREPGSVSRETVAPEKEVENV